MSGILHKAENAILGHQQETKDSDENQLEDSGKSGVHQPHKSKLANKIDPRIHRNHGSGEFKYYIHVHEHHVHIMIHMYLRLAGHQDFDFDSEPSASMSMIPDRTKTGGNSQPYTEDNMTDGNKGPYNTDVADEFEQRVISEDQGRGLEEVKITRPTKQDRLVGV
ncbi:hypothetical protein N7493_009123 [Penicillium malachiteum]|uniref:Uncharacterized protein n=1 Tax=Penicillium malachiteum TaxID=1324776 RepID=A0AAD6MT37_9EURO|nr:hypothetical protein N7493_009123 [Penicillium malachiteum]